MIQTDGSTRKGTSEKGLHGRVAQTPGYGIYPNTWVPQIPVLGTWDSNNLNRRVPHPFRVILRNGWESECPDLRMQAASTVIPSIGTRQLANRPSWPCQPLRGRHFLSHFPSAISSASALQIISSSPRTMESASGDPVRRADQNPKTQGVRRRLSLSPLLTNICL